MQPEYRVRSFIGTGYDDWSDPGFHDHGTLEISVLLEGRGLFEDEYGRRSLEAGHVTIVPSSVPHRFEGFGKSRYAVMHLEGIPRRVAEPLGKLANGDKPVFYSLSRLDKERFERLFREWLHIQASPLREKHANYASWTEVMVLFLLEHSRKDQRALSVTGAADYIRENLRQAVPISEMAALAGLSEAGFRRLFEQIYQVSPKKYQQTCRMAEAKWLLSAADKDLVEIAVQIGFSRLHSFSL